MRRFGISAVVGTAVVAMVAFAPIGAHADGLPDGYLDFCLSGWVKSVEVKPELNTVETWEICRDFGGYAVVTDYALPPQQPKKPPKPKDKGPNT